ncbi:MAG: prepilin-type N-terminal cleavage/methylation domain-containing protein [Zavarzinella sp.]
MILTKRSFVDHPTKAVRGAFTLLEVLVVVTIIMILASFATVATFKVLEDNKYTTANVQSETWAKAVSQFIVKNQANPDNLEQVATYISGDERSLVNPWNNPYTMTIEDTEEGPVIYISSDSPKGPIQVMRR